MEGDQEEVTTIDVFGSDLSTYEEHLQQLTSLEELKKEGEALDRAAEMIKMRTEDLAVRTEELKKKKELFLKWNKPLLDGLF
ncbi:hypothetical protein MKW98_019471 [Papaver atlanticum]|uniref:Uncharacterized protein n=1 Tax=Papaver atlanticum TaxID=357466 RepID=A0AAD4XB32_9MAGN|nr:hypothetical protein MKW98_019471 [Papaver atlanticum]